MNWLIDDPTAVVLASLFLAMILAAAAVPKLRQPEEFQGVVANYRLLPAFLVTPFCKIAAMGRAGLCSGTACATGARNGCMVGRGSFRDVRAGAGNQRRTRSYTY